MGAIDIRGITWRLTGPVFLLALALPHARAATPSPGDSTPSPRESIQSPGRLPEAAIRVFIEPIAVDGLGTRSLGAEIADIFPGDAGVLGKSVTLRSRVEGDPTRENLELTIRVSPSLREQGDCELLIDARVSLVVAGASAGRNPPAVRKMTNLQVGPDEERMIKIYESAATGGRLALRVRCGPRPTGTEVEEDPRVDFVLSIERADGEGPFEILTSKVLTTGIGREAKNLFSINDPLPGSEQTGKRYRRERFEIRIAPELLSAGRLQAVVEVDGEVAVVSALDPIVVHPIWHRETAVVAPGESRTIDIEVRASAEDEGWSLLRYRLQIVAHFEPR